MADQPNYNRIAGTTSDDKITGTAAADEIHLGTGNDSADGGAGDDLIYGDAGNDTLVGGAGNDQIYGGSGDDSLSGGSGNDTLYCDGGNDKVQGGSGNDQIFVAGDLQPALLNIDGQSGTDEVVLPGKRNDYEIENNLTGLVLRDMKNSVFILLSNVEKLRFSDQVVSDTDLRKGSIDYLQSDKGEKISILKELQSVLQYGSTFKAPGATISYGFLVSPGYYSKQKLPANEEFQFAEFTDYQKSATRETFEYLEAILNVKFSEAAANPTSAYIRFQMSNMTAGGYTVPPISVTSSAGSVNLSIKKQTDTDIGGYGIFTIIHEVGHALGLKHPADYESEITSAYMASAGTEVPYYYDRTSLSIMSYQDVMVNSNYKNSFSPLDWKNLIGLYGANSESQLKTFRIHHDKNLFGKSEQGLYNIFDGSVADIQAYAPFTVIGMRQDTVIDLSDCNADCTIDFSKYAISFNGAEYTEFLGYNYLDSTSYYSPLIDIYPFSKIATVLGGSANDSLISPFEISEFDGREGIDTVFLSGDRSGYTLTGDVQSGFTVRDNVHGTSMKLLGIEVIEFGNKERISVAPIIGTADDDEIHLTDSDDVVDAGDGWDLIWSVAGNDQVSASAGGDDIQLLAGSTATIDGGPGIDVVHIGNTKSAYSLGKAIDGGSFLLTELANGKQSLLSSVEVVNFKDGFVIPDHSYGNLKALNAITSVDINVMLAFNLWYGDSFKTPEGRKTVVTLNYAADKKDYQMAIADAYNLLQYYWTPAKDSNGLVKGAMYSKDLDKFIDNFLTSQHANEMSTQGYVKLLVTNYYDNPNPSQSIIDTVVGWLDKGIYDRHSLFRVALLTDTDDLFNITLTGMSSPLPYSYNPFA